MLYREEISLGSQRLGVEKQLPLLYQYYRVGYVYS